MTFFVVNNRADVPEDDEEEEMEGEIDDALLEELDDDAVEADDLLDEEVDPLLAVGAFADEEKEKSERNAIDEDGAKIFEDDDDEDVDDYDSFDDEDEL